MIFHCHQFTETQRVHAPPVKRTFEVQWIHPSDLDRYVFGQTTIITKCTCGRLRTTVVAGDARQTLAERDEARGVR